ncbi:putative membrane protein [Pectobacterium atrosepticum SCRI1043]|uniref:Membrane protein n=1 Tax=Pectobacterium atrosepticum (strain SCRI 1043 / ATCC BAA-672) TaxID=218491 RepID=Q6D8G0_PECAS|nr:putative membrane protein [Pectobacterium atrosepticum SCRI1043]
MRRGDLRCFWLVVVMLCLLFFCLLLADVVASLPYSLPVHLPCLSKVIFYVAPQIAVLFFAYDFTPERHDSLV